MPILVSYDETSAAITLTALTGSNAGGSTITLYDLYWDAGSSGTTFTSYVQ